MVNKFYDDCNDCPYKDNCYWDGMCELRDKPSQYVEIYHSSEESSEETKEEDK